MGFGMDKEFNNTLNEDVADLDFLNERCYQAGCDTRAPTRDRETHWSAKLILFLASDLRYPYISKNDQQNKPLNNTAQYM